MSLDGRKILSRGNATTNIQTQHLTSEQQSAVAAAGVSEIVLARKEGKVVLTVMSGQNLLGQAVLASPGGFHDLGGYATGFGLARGPSSSDLADGARHWGTEITIPYELQLSLPATNGPDIGLTKPLRLQVETPKSNVLDLHKEVSIGVPVGMAIYLPAFWAAVYGAYSGLWKGDASAKDVFYVSFPVAIVSAAVMVLDYKYGWFTYTTCYYCPSK